MDNETPQTKEQHNDELLTLWTKRFQQAESNQQPMFSAFERFYDAFYAVFKQKMAPWRSKIVDPKLASKAVSTIAKLAIVNPEPELGANETHDIVRAKNNESILIYQMNNPLFPEPMFLKKVGVLTDSVVTGTGVGMAPWTVEKKTFYSRRMNDGKISLKDERKIEKTIGYNDFIPWSVFQVFLDPTSTTFQGNWAIFRDYKSSKWVKKQKSNGWDIPDEMTEKSSVSSFEASRNRFLNEIFSNAGAKSGVEIWYCFDMEDMKKVIIIGQGHIALEDDIVDWHQKIPAVPFYMQPRAMNPWGVGIFERSERLGAANNNLINHFFDQLDLSLNGWMLRDEGTVITQQDTSPGGEVVYSGLKPEWVRPDSPDLQGFQVGRQVLAEAIEENTLPAYEQGIPRAANDKTKGTFGGIQEIKEAAGDLVRYFEMSIASGYQQLYQIWLSNNQQYLDYNIAVRILGKNGWFPKIITPEDMITQGTLDVRVDVDSMRPRSRIAQAQNTLAYIDRQMAIFDQSMKAGKPITINWYELSRTAADAFNITGFDNIVEPVDQRADSATEENNLILMGKEFSPSDQDDHEAHIAIHKSLLDDANLDPELKRNTETHIAMHAELMKTQQEAKDQAEQENLDRFKSETANQAGVPTIPVPTMHPGGMTPPQMTTNQGNNVPVPPPQAVPTAR